jgi:hypothetical protein
MAIKACIAAAGQISAVTVEYGLFDKYCWPRGRSMVGFQRISFARMPIESSKRSHATVNALLDSIGARVNAPDASRPRAGPLSGKVARAWRDSAAAYRKARGLRRFAAQAPCDSAVGRVVVRKRDELPWR